MSAWPDLPNLPPANCVFQICEEEVNKIGALNVVKDSKGSIENAIAKGQFHVTKAERGDEGIRCGSFGIFTQAVEMEESHVGHCDNETWKGGKVKIAT